MTLSARFKWDRASRGYDFATRSDEWRYGAAKRRLFASMRGRCLMLAAGTGHDFRFFPSDLRITAIDISGGMLAQATRPACDYAGQLDLAQMDAQSLAFADARFDTIASVCTFCSVPRPVEGLKALRRVLVPGGELHMFEHTGSRYFPFNSMLNQMTWLSSRFGPDMNRDTVTNVKIAGFTVREVSHVYMDVVKTISATA